MSYFSYFFDPNDPDDPGGDEPEIKQIKDNGADRVRLLRDFAFQRPNGQVWVALTGLEFDGASIPKVFWGLATNPFASDVLPAAIIHDQYCAYGRAGTSPYDSATVHKCFYEGLRVLGVPWWRARARYLAVRFFGPRFKASPDA